MRLTYARCWWALLGCWVLAVWATAAGAGTLTKADIQAMFHPPLVVGEKLVHVPVWPVFTKTATGMVLQNHAFETVDLEPVAGYGGKPINILVVMDRDGAYLYSRLISHTEPIFRSEKGTATLAEFAHQYVGATVNHQVQVLGAKAQRVVTPTTATLHGIVAGTVTAMAMDRSIMESAAQVAQSTAAHAAASAGEIAAHQVEARAQGASSGPDDRYQRNGFNGLAAAGLVQPWAMENRALEELYLGSPGAGKDAEGTIRPRGKAIDTWWAWASIPQVGRNLLTPVRWREVRALREAGTPVLLVLDSSRYPLSATSPAAAASAGKWRGALVGATQGGKPLRMEQLPWSEGLRLSGQHSGVGAGAVARYFKVLPAPSSNPGQAGNSVDYLAPVQLSLEAWRRSSDGAAHAVALKREYSIDDAKAYAPAREAPRWMEAWGQRVQDLIITGLGLAVLTLGLVWQRRLAASRKRLRGLRTVYLLFTLGFIGWWAQGQLTVVSLTALVEALLAGRSAEFLLLDPLAVLLWGFTFIALAVWGRGTFCGWLCPFGALQELIARVVQAAGFAQKRLRVALDRRLKWIKYGVLVALLGAAAAAPAAAEWMVEVEPFKTAISLYFVRSWPYVLWAGACLALSAIVYRGYCRYICPLGAALAVLGLARRWAWIPRKAECGTPCQSCRHGCEYQAIEPSGKVAYTECFQCLDCVQIHDDEKRCLPLVAKASGKTIPIRAVPANAGAGAPR